ncbi:condensation domain-containing protein, partial [Streptomyces sp. bgisy032]|uniref:condensation domain-containing protein n=1 Tax=Streptomyces sp. bgisy032 TaxID=3413773 RepID=UPI003D71B74F
MPLLPVGAWLTELTPQHDRFSMSLICDLPVGIGEAELLGTLAAVLDRHDVLRSRLVRGEGGCGWELEVSAPGSVPVAGLVRRVSCDGRWRSPGWRAVAARELDAALGGLDPAGGVMARFVWFDAGGGTAGRLLIVLHHFVVDGVSWRILLPDLAQAYARVREGRAAGLAGVGTSVRRWAHALVEEAGRRGSELGYWRGVLGESEPVLGRRGLDPVVDTMATVRTVRVVVPAGVTRALLTSVPAVFGGGVNDGLLAALGLSVARWRGRERVLVRLEGHGREEVVVPGADLSRTVGWFTSMFPVRLDVSGVDVDEAFAGGGAAGRVVKAVKEQLLAVPDRGVGFGLLRYLHPVAGGELARAAQPQIGFNYLGRFSASDMPEELRGLGWTQVGEFDEIEAGL